MKLPEQENSDLVNPLRWFDSFIENNLPFCYRDDFFSEAKRIHQYNDLEIDYENDSFSYTFITSDDGWKHKDTLTYSKYLNDIVEFEKVKSIKLIKQKTEPCTSDGEIIFILKTLTDQLTNIINRLKKKNGHPIREFSFIPTGIYGIVDHISSAYASFLPNPLPEIFAEAKSPPLNLFSNLLDKPKIIEKVKNDTQKGNKSELGNDRGIDDFNSKNEVLSFQWINNPEHFTTELYYILIDLVIIKASETDILKFRKAFNGLIINEPIMIKWHLKNNRNSFKVPIIRMLNYLMNDLKLLQKVNLKAEYARKIENIFIGSDGKNLKATEVTLQNIGRLPTIGEKDMLTKLANLNTKKV